MLYPIFKNRIVILLIYIFCFKPMNGQNQIIDTTTSTIFNPDTTVNGLALRNEKSLKLFYSKSFELTPESEKHSFPVAYFYNIHSTEYLAIYHYDGDLKDEFSLFEVGYCNGNEYNKFAKHTIYDQFTTENKVRLGMTKKELIQIKGTNYISLYKGQKEIIRYILDDINSLFLSKYKMPTYYAEYCIEQDVVVKFTFGFEYP